MSIHQEFGAQVLVQTADKKIHLADFSDITAKNIDPQSVQQAIRAYFIKHNLTPLSTEESARHGFPTHEPRLDRLQIVERPKRR